MGTLNYLRPLFVEQQEFQGRRLALIGLVVSTVLLVTMLTASLLGSEHPLLITGIFLLVPLSALLAGNLAKLRVTIDATGIHVRHFPFVYVANGGRGVRIEFSNGHRLTLGTQRPDELAAALAEARIGT